MAKIGIENIDEIKVNVIPLERTYDSVGDLKINSAVKRMYITKGYPSAPKSREEADKRGEIHFNGLMSSFTKIKVYEDSDTKLVSVDIVPTRYLIGQAMRDYMKKFSDQLHTNKILSLSPNMANVSLIAPIEKNDGYYLLSQIKGKALGSGQIHTGIVAVNIAAKYLADPDPLTGAIRGGCSSELGMKLDQLDPTSTTFMVDERETGQVNFASVLKNADFGDIYSSYESSVKDKSLEDLEVMGIALLPTKNINQFIREGIARDVTCFIPTENGLEEKKQDRQLRPYTVATLKYIKRPKNLEFLIKKAGF
ncbi:MAG: hypothetical protein JSW73_04285 [Candidatus Woesearchaeota archaeon]|nr:MAG: hypothetical protein JSW73_04285 [Candidatus Woesearchaeota archaeon]